MNKYLFTIGLFPIMLMSCQQAASQVGESSQWRGVNRDGVYHETGLLKEWPPNGPELLWHYEGLGDGWTSVAIANKKIYITGLHDEDLVLFVFDLTGKLLNQKTVGKEWNSQRHYPGTRGTVNVNDGMLYIYNSFGTLICLDETSLNEVWRKDVIEEFGGRNIMWGMTESPLIVGEKIFITPGGETHNLVALNKKTGALIWSSPGIGTVSSYCSPQFIGGYSVPILVTCTRQEIIAFNADTGEVLWSHPHPSNNTINPNTPMYFNGMINYAVRMEYLHKNMLSKIGNFKETFNVKPKMNVYTKREFRKFIKSAKNADTKVPVINPKNYLEGF